MLYAKTAPLVSTILAQIPPADQPKEHPRLKSESVCRATRVQASVSAILPGDRLFSVHALIVRGHVIRMNAGRSRLSCKSSPSLSTAGPRATVYDILELMAKVTL